MGTTAVGKNVTLEEVLLHVKELEERVAALERLTDKPAPQPVRRSPVSPSVHRADSLSPAGLSRPSPKPCWDSPAPISCAP